MISRYVLITFLKKIKVAMKQHGIKNHIVLLTLLIFSMTFFIDSAFGQETVERSKLLQETIEPFFKGEYEKAIEIFDQILENNPNDIHVLGLKGLALSNLRLESTLAMQPQQNTTKYDESNLNRLAMMEFYKILELNPNNIFALNAMGVGFGNFGEYSEAEKYFKKSLEINPDNEITQNYLISLEKIRKKYALDVFEKPTKKPDILQTIEEDNIPIWVKNNAKWWSDDKISDNDFISGIQYLIEKNIINIKSENIKENSSDVIPTWIKNNAKWWSTGKIPDSDFLSGIKYLVENNIIIINSQIPSKQSQQESERKAWNFQLYLRNIQTDMKIQNRYIENLNPSEYVIIKYWKDSHKWNLEQFLTNPNAFPDREVLVEPDGNYLIKYNVHINEQPDGLPIDHVSTLNDSFSFWEKAEYNTTDDKKAKVSFDIVGSRSDASIWITWVVRNMGEGVLGHANLDKGVVEVAIGNYGCDGSFQLFDKDTVEYIMTHELGHSLGFYHSDDPDSIMYPTVPSTSYAYCLLQ